MGYLRAILASLITLACMGCQPEPVQPRTGNVPLEIWIVLAPGENVGGVANRGSRYSIPDIVAFLGQLQENNRIYGGNVNFQIPEYALGVYDYLLSSQARPHPNNWFRDNVLANYWTPGRLNIYFTGAYQTGPPIGLPIAFTRDPSHTGAFGVPYIVINDPGRTESSGYAPAHLPAFYRQSHVLEHEVAHFFLRRTNTPCYDDLEHTPCLSPELLKLLMHGCGYPSIRPLGMPSGEQVEMWCRIWNGTWVAPSWECGP